MSAGEQQTRTGTAQLYRELCDSLAVLTRQPSGVKTSVIDGARVARADVTPNLPTAHEAAARVVSALLQEDSPLAALPSLRPKIQELQSTQSLLSSPAADPQKVAEMLNELRFFLLAVALLGEGLGAGPPNGAPLVQLLNDGAEPTISGLEQLESGIVHGLMGSLRLVVLPAVRAEAAGGYEDGEFHKIYHDFSAIEEQERSNHPHHWILDLSLVEHVPLLLFANIIAYSQRLRNLGRQMLLFSLRKDLFSPQQYSRVREHFRLTEIGGLLYSLNSTH